MYWENVSYDTERESEARKLSMARVATAKYWPIIAQAKTEDGLYDVCDLISEGVMNAITPIAESPAEIAVLSSKVFDSFVEDWNLHVAKSDPYERHIQWSKANGHDPDTVAALKAHEKAKGISRNEANQIADQQYIGGGDTNWRSQKDAALANSVGAGQEGNKSHSNGKMDEESFNKSKDAYKNTHKECSNCNGSGRDAGHTCKTCGGDGMVKKSTLHTATSFEVRPHPNAKDKWGVWSKEHNTCVTDSMSKSEAERKHKELTQKASDLGHTAVIEDAHGESQRMQSQWGLPVDLSDDTAKQLQSEVNSAEAEDRATRINRGNGIGVADESSGNYVEGPGKNQGEDPILHGNDNSHLDNHTASYYVIDNFGALLEATASTKGAFLVTADNEDQVDENEDMQSESAKKSDIDDDEWDKTFGEGASKRYHEDEESERKPKKSSVQIAAINKAQEMVDAMPKEASVEAVKKEMLRRAASLKLNSEETDLVVSAAVTHAYEMGRRPLDKESGAPGRGDNLKKPCPICGKLIPASEFKNHMKKDHPSIALNNIASLEKEEVRSDTHNSVYLHYPTTTEGSKYSVGCHTCGAGQKVKTVSVHDDEDDARRAFKKHYEMHDNQRSKKTSGMDSFAPSADSGSSENEDQGGSSSDDFTGSDPGGNSSSSNLPGGEQVGGSGASADLASENNGTSTVAVTSPPRTKPSHNPNAVTKSAPTPPIVALPSAGTQPGIPAPTSMNPLASPQMQANLRIADKLVEITEGILSTNPGMNRTAAISIANRTLSQYPAILHKEAWGGADWLPNTNPNDYAICPQCQKHGFNPKINRCHQCGFVDVSGHEPDSNDSSWDSISGKTTIKPGTKTFKNPGGN